MQIISENKSCLTQHINCKYILKLSRNTNWTNFSPNLTISIPDNQIKKFKGARIQFRPENESCLTQ